VQITHRESPEQGIIEAWMGCWIKGPWAELSGNWDCQMDAGETVSGVESPGAGRGGCQRGGGWMSEELWRLHEKGLSSVESVESSNSRYSYLLQNLPTLAT